MNSHQNKYKIITVVSEREEVLVWSHLIQITLMTDGELLYLLIKFNVITLVLLVTHY